MENANVCEVILSKKLDKYGDNSNDFVATGELTVTITLSEYRALVTNKATRDVDVNKANIDRYQRESENKSLKEEVAKLKAELYELKSTNCIREEKLNGKSDYSE